MVTLKPGRCSHLQLGEDGKYVCDIYEDRPEYCRAAKWREYTNREYHASFDEHHFNIASELICKALQAVVGSLGVDVEWESNREKRAREEREMSQQCSALTDGQGPAGN